MKKVIRLTESDLTRIVRRVIAEQEMEEGWLGDKFKGLKKFARGYGDEAEYEMMKDSFMKTLEKFDMEVMNNPEEYNKGDQWEDYREELIDKAEDNNYMGKLLKRTSPNSDKYFIVYFPGMTGLEGLGAGAAGASRAYQSRGEF